MAVETMDLMVLTFNCAKNFIDGEVFAGHMRGALRDGAQEGGLPDLICLSLQEVAPMSYSFIGGYCLEPYILRFEDAINQAAITITESLPKGPSSTTPNDSSSSSTPQEPSSDGVNRSRATPRKPYSIVRTHNVGYTAILLLAKDPDAVRSVDIAEVGFGVADTGNKGAVGLRVLWEKKDGKSNKEGKTTELTFVATHLAAMEWNLPKRNANWASIVRGMTFEDPEAVVTRWRASEEGTPESSESSTPSERTRLLPEDHNLQHTRLQRHLHNISIFKPSSHLFVAGDLNYRISSTAPPPNAAFPDLDPLSENYYPAWWGFDQLTRERKAGRTLHGLSEGEVRFPPTYKYDVKGKKKGGDVHDGEDEVEWEFAPHRYPSWTDRVLYLETPSWIEEGGRAEKKIQVKAYNAMPISLTSDHRAVYKRFTVPILTPEEMTPPLEVEDTSRGELSRDPRVRLPVEVDPEAWGRRAAARRKEVMAGYSMWVWGTKEGWGVLGTVVAVGVGVWWWRVGL